MTEMINEQPNEIRDIFNKVKQKVEDNAAKAKAIEEVMQDSITAKMDIPKDPRFGDKGMFRVDRDFIEGYLDDPMDIVGALVDSGYTVIVERDDHNDDYVITFEFK